MKRKKLRQNKGKVGKLDENAHCNHDVTWSRLQAGQIKIHVITWSYNMIAINQNLKPSDCDAHDPDNDEERGHVLRTNLELHNFNPKISKLNPQLFQDYHLHISQDLKLVFLTQHPWIWWLDALQWKFLNSLFGIHFI